MEGGGGRRREEEGGGGRREEGGGGMRGGGGGGRGAGNVLKVFSPELDDPTIKLIPRCLNFLVTRKA